ncbi:hypothetical protein ACJX0J_039093, partial [Zea mays]
MILAACTTLDDIAHQYTPCFLHLPLTMFITQHMAALEIIKKNWILIGIPVTMEKVFIFFFLNQIVAMLEGKLSSILVLWLQRLAKSFLSLFPSNTPNSKTGAEIFMANLALGFHVDLPTHMYMIPNNKFDLVLAPFELGFLKRSINNKFLSSILDRYVIASTEHLPIHFYDVFAKKTMSGHIPLFMVSKPIPWLSIHGEHKESPPEIVVNFLFTDKIMVEYPLLSILKDTKMHREPHQHPPGSEIKRDEILITGG